MKIFNWVHRKFHHKEDLSGEIKKAEEFVIGCKYDVEKEALLEHVSFGGVLTIGTFGFHHHFNDDDDLIYETEEDEYKQCGDDEQEENSDDIINYSGTATIDRIDDDDDEEEEEEEGEVKPLLISKGSSRKIDYPECDENDIEISVSVGSRANVNEQIGVINDKKKRSGERVTLADLFSADSEINNNNVDKILTNNQDGNEKNYVKKMKKKQQDEEDDYSIGKSGGHRRPKNRLSFTKKLIPHQLKDQNSLPVHHKLQKLVTRMMKRKIHPEDEGKKNIHQSMPSIITAH